MMKAQYDAKKPAGPCHRSWMKAPNFGRELSENTYTIKKKMILRIAGKV